MSNINKIDENIDKIINFYREYGNDAIKISEVLTLISKNKKEAIQIMKDIKDSKICTLKDHRGRFIFTTLPNCPIKEQIIIDGQSYSHIIISLNLTEEEKLKMIFAKKF
ncbi:hypothetical protein NZ45_00875 [Clostridium botulinum]|uniref:Uncharacterized protein n=1 Tax=Clostridium botulinum TaxID=1491 RepID=A0ABD7CGA7_CLOBO|nr:hypothetical protein [Clostridium botulinum]KGO15590.1 hypothetical protein NZ45_00875 [Clostridium botulinum]QRI51989.1 hypothetical protein JQS73_11030 [Clostridium botulinum]